MNQRKTKQNRVLIIDNYDSFTYNLVHIVEKIIDDEVVVVRNDEIEFHKLNDFQVIILSPGPGLPEEAGYLKRIISICKESHKILGVCLGMQAIAEVEGARLRNLDKVYHGVKTEMHIRKKDSLLFKGIPESFEAGRYHSWVIESDTLPESLLVSCVDDENNIMALEHSQYRLYGVQFHPESVLTETGEIILRNFLFET